MFLLLRKIYDRIKTKKGEFVQLENRLCRDMDTNVFYPDLTNLQEVRDAILVCRKCPAQIQCLQMAMDADEEYGVWGGATPGERKYMRRYKVSARDYAAIKCGTEAAYYRHRRMSEGACIDCKVAFKINHGNKTLKGTRSR